MGQHTAFRHGGLCWQLASFEAGELDISTLPPSGGPPALWAAGRFYLRQPNTNRYVAGAYHLSLNGPDVAHFTLTGSSGGGALSGAFDATQAGVFAVMQNGSVPVAACPANEDGTLRLGAAAVPEQLPPAVMISGAGILRFIGTPCLAKLLFATSAAHSKP